jgi:hypothetical protein
MIAVETPKGDGLAAFLIDYGLESDLYFVVFLENREIWTFATNKVRLKSNITAGRN